MPARTGAAFLQGLKESEREVYIQGERVTDVTQHPAFRNILNSLAGLYDLQHAPDTAADMLYTSPDTGDQVATAFLLPRSADDLAKRSRAMDHTARFSQGMLGRTPDYLSSSLMAFAAGHEFFGKADARSGTSIVEYYELAREQDLCLTHTLVNPQANRAVGPAQQKDPFLSARIARETDAGIVIRGARMLATLGPLADEIMVMPSTVVRSGEDDAPYAFGFSIPCDTPGLSFICRDSYDHGRPRFDAPLSSRFEEIDSVVIFDDVEVPWERVFIHGDPEVANAAFGATNAVVHMAHQVMAKNIAKTEFILGLVSLIVDTIGIEPFQHVHEKVSEVIIGLESMRALRRAAEVDAKLDRWGIMTPAFAPLDAARNLYPKLYPRFVEIVQQLSASGLMATPTEADVNGPMAAVIERYFGAARADARDRIALFRLAWDVAISAFGSRQALYERFFFGDPVRMAGAHFHTYDREPYMEMVREFLRDGIQKEDAS